MNNFNWAKFGGVRLVSILAAIALALTIQMVAKTGSSFAYSLVGYAGLYVTLAVSLNLINGITGQFSIGHAGFYMVGAYTSGWLSLTYLKGSSLPHFVIIFISMFLGGLFAGIMGYVVGLPSLRLKGDYLAIVTLGFGEILRIVANNLDMFNHASGFNVTPKTNEFVWLIWLLAFFVIAVCRNLLQNSQGLAFLSIREDEVAAGAMGVNTTKIKVTAFALGSMFAGMAGSLYANFDGFLQPDKFKMDVSFVILTMVVLGGTGSITGSVVAAILLYWIPEQLRSLGQVPMSSVISGMIAIGLGVYVLRIVANKIHTKRLGPNLGVFAGAVLIGWLGSKAIFAMGLTKTIDGNLLRQPILAITLIVLMLLRPQGIFAHHEFSWDWVMRKLGRKPAQEVA